MTEQIDEFSKKDGMINKLYVVWIVVGFLSSTAAGIYSLLAFNSLTLFTPLIFVVIALSLLCIHLLFIILIYRNWRFVGIHTQISTILWSGLVIWYWCFSPIYYLISINFTHAQLTLIAFAYFWEVDVLGGLYILLCLLIFRPFHNYLLGKESSIKSPQAAYDFLSKFPIIAAILIVIIVTFGFVLGIIQQVLFAQMPPVEQIKLLIHGVLSSILLGLYVALLLGRNFDKLRRIIKEKNPEQLFKVKGFTARIFGSTIVVVIATLGLLLIIVFNSFQGIVKTIVDKNATGDFHLISDYLAGNISKPDHFGINSQMFVFTPSLPQPDNVSSETWRFLAAHTEGNLDDARKDLKTVIFRTNPDTGGKEVLIVHPGDYYFYFKDFFVSLGIASFLLVFFVGIALLLITKIVLGSLVSIKKAIHGESGDILKLDVSTGDEVEGLAFTVKYYANKAHAMQGNLEKMVSEQTDTLSKQIKEIENKNAYLGDSSRAMLNILEDARELELAIKEERDHVQGIISSIGEGVFVVDISYKVTLMNPVAEKLLGKSFAEAKGKSVLELFSIYEGDKKLPDNQRPAAVVLQTGQSFIAGLERDLYFVTHDNKKLPVAVAATPLKGDGVTGAVVAFRDITAEKNIKEAIEMEVKVRTHQLTEEKSKLQASINSLSVGLIMTDKFGKVLIMNDTATRTLCRHQESNNTGVLTHPVKGQCSMEEIEKNLNGAINLEEKIKQCLEEKKPLEFKDIPFFDRILRITISPIVTLKETLEIIGTVILVDDVTEAKIIDRSKDEFFSIASHELRTPLTSIKGNTSMIRDYYAASIKEPELKEMIDDIHDSSVRLIEIVNDFLDMSRLEQGKMVFKKEEVDLTKVIEQVVYELAAIVKDKGIFLKFVPPTLGTVPTVQADSDRTKQVVYNLVGNSVKFTEKGGVTVEINTDGDFVKVRVSDTGRGISGVNQNLLFRKFQQASSSLFTRDTTKGTGLGLYISKTMIENMGGVIQLEKSEEGKGTTFAFTLPIFKGSPEVTPSKEMEQVSK